MMYSTYGPCIAKLGQFKKYQFRTHETIPVLETVIGPVLVTAGITTGTYTLPFEGRLSVDETRWAVDTTKDETICFPFTDVVKYAFKDGGIKLILKEDMVLEYVLLKFEDAEQKDRFLELLAGIEEFEEPPSNEVVGYPMRTKFEFDFDEEEFLREVIYDGKDPEEFEDSEDSESGEESDETEE